MMDRTSTVIATAAATAKASLLDSVRQLGHFPSAGAQQ